MPFSLPPFWLHRYCAFRGPQADKLRRRLRALRVSSDVSSLIFSIPIATMSSNNKLTLYLMTGAAPFSDLVPRIAAIPPKKTGKNTSDHDTDSSFGPDSDDEPGIETTQERIALINAGLPLYWTMDRSDEEIRYLHAEYSQGRMTPSTFATAGWSLPERARQGRSPTPGTTAPPGQPGAVSNNRPSSSTSTTTRTQGQPRASNNRRPSSTESQSPPPQENKRHRTS